MAESGKISIAIGIWCNQGKQEGHNEDEPEHFWPVDKDTTFDFSICPLVPPAGWDTECKSFRIQVPKKLPTTEDSKENNTTEGVAAHVASQLNSRLGGTGVSVSSRAGGHIADGESHAGSPIAILEFEGVRAVDAAWDYTKITGWMWATPGVPDPGQPAPATPTPWFRVPPEDWPGWAPGEPPPPFPGRGRKPRRPGTMPGRKQPGRGQPHVVFSIGPGPYKRLTLAIHLGPYYGMDFPHWPDGWWTRTFEFDAGASPGEVAIAVAEYLRDLNHLRPPLHGHLPLNGAMWSVDADEDALPGSMHFLLGVEPLRIQPVLGTPQDRTAGHLIPCSTLPPPGGGHPSTPACTLDPWTEVQVWRQKMVVGASSTLSPRESNAGVVFEQEPRSLVNEPRRAEPKEHL